MKYDIDDRPGFLPMLMYGMQWWAVSIPCVLIMGIIIASAHYTEISDKILYMQKLFIIIGTGMGLQVMFGHRLPVVIGPASVLLIGILATISSGIPAIYTSVAICGMLVAILSFSGMLSRLQKLFTPRIIIVILCLIAFTLSPVIIKLAFGNGGNQIYNLVFVTAASFLLILTNKILRGIWKSMTILIGIIAGSAIYSLLIQSEPETAAILAETTTSDSMAGILIPSLKIEIPTLISFFFCFIALMVNEIGSIQAVAGILRANDAEKRTKAGMGITGIMNMVSGIFGVAGPVDYSMSPGVIFATGCASRYTLLPAAAALIICGLISPLINLLNAIPEPVMAAMLLYLMGSQLAAGLQMTIKEKAVSSFEEGIIIGFPLMIALMLSFAPADALNSIPATIRPIAGNGFVMGVISVILLEHLVFRKKV